MSPRCGYDAHHESPSVHSRVVLDVRSIKKRCEVRLVSSRATREEQRNGEKPLLPSPMRREGAGPVVAAPCLQRGVSPLPWRRGAGPVRQLGPSLSSGQTAPPSSLAASRPRRKPPPPPLSAGDETPTDRDTEFRHRPTWRLTRARPWKLS